MDQQTVLTIFVGICALAMLIQMAMLIGLLVVAKRLADKVMAFLPEVQAVIPQAQAILRQVQGVIPEVKSVVEVTKQTLEDVKRHASDIGDKASAIAEVTKGQVIKIDELLTDVASRTRAQLDRAELVLDDAMSRTQRTVSYVQNGVVAPIREVHGVLSGLRAALVHLGRGHRPTVDHATADEEMFI